MVFKYSFVFLFFCVGLSLHSCVQEENNSVQIKFAKVVGNYSGESKICKPISFSSDTTCSAGLSNLIKVIIFDSQSIIIDDELDIFGNSKLINTADTIILNKRVFIFDSQETTEKFKLVFYENEGVIKITNPFSNGSQILVNYFDGKKQ